MILKRNCLIKTNQGNIEIRVVMISGGDSPNEEVDFWGG